jgi:hypothetical protein
MAAAPEVVGGRARVLVVPVALVVGTSAALRLAISSCSLARSPLPSWSSQTGECQRKYVCVCVRACVLFYACRDVKVKEVVLGEGEQLVAVDLRVLERLFVVAQADLKRRG